MLNDLYNPITLEEFMSVYRTKDDNIQYELINGLVSMTPAPSRVHQKLSKFLSTRIDNFLIGKKCELYYSPFDVFLYAENSNMESNTVVQPDLLVVCDKNKLKDNGCHGAPDFVVEIVSPSTMGNDYATKLNLYMMNGVKEYWIVNSANNKILVYSFSSNRTIQDFDTYTFDEKVKISTLGNLEIDFSEFDFS